MQIQRIGFTPVKGGRHTEHRHVDLTADGPVGDRVFCLVDRERARVLRTVENHSLLRAEATYSSGVLSVHLPDQSVEGRPEPTGQRLKADYWGRTAQVEIVDGPWATAYSAHLDRDVVLARSVSPGEVVYGAPVTLVSTASMAELDRRIGRETSSARFRSTLLVDTADSELHVEDAWVGRDLIVGEARLTVRGIVPRCAVVDLDPATGRRDGDVLATLAGYRRGDGEINFGVDAVVSTPGRIRHGDGVSLAGRG